MIKLKEKITEIEFKNEIVRLYNEYGKVNKNIFNKYSIYKDSNFHWYCTKFGGIKNILKSLDIIDASGIYTKDEVIKMALSLYNKYGYINKNLCVNNGISSCVIRRIFGSFTELYKQINVEPNIQRNVSKDDIKEDILKIYQKYNTTSSNIYRKYGKYSQTIIDNVVGGWENIIDELELTTASNSSGETMIESILKEMNIEYKKHFNFEWLISNEGNKLYIDFYIPKYNIVIEYDGLQHYRFIKYFHKTIDNFYKYVERDKYKESLIISHNIKIHRILYNQDIKKSLNNILNLYM